MYSTTPEELTVALPARTTGTPQAGSDLNSDITRGGTENARWDVDLSSVTDVRAVPRATTKVPTEFPAEFEFFDSKA